MPLTSNSLIPAYTGAILALFSSASLLASEADFFQVIDMKSSSSLNIRELPSPAAKPVGRIPAATNIDIFNLGCLTPLEEGEFPWCEVRWNGIQGWASSYYLAERSYTPSVASPETGNTANYPTQVTPTTPSAEPNILDLPDATIWRPLN